MFCEGLAGEGSGSHWGLRHGGQGGSHRWLGDLTPKGHRAHALARLSAEVLRGSSSSPSGSTEGERRLEQAPSAVCPTQRWMGWARTQEEVGLESSLLTPAEIYGAASSAHWGCHSANVIGTRWRWQGGDRGGGEAGAVGAQCLPRAGAGMGPDL